MATAQDKLDVSLDDLISSKKPSNTREEKTAGKEEAGRGGRRGGRRRRSKGAASDGAAPAAAALLRTVAGGGVGKKGKSNASLLTKTITNPAAKKTKYDKGGEGLFTGARLDITNLDYGVTDLDLKQIFEDVGEIKKAAIDFDKLHGRSLGTGYVIFREHRLALAAIRKFNGERLDGRPMQIALAKQSGVAAPQLAKQSGVAAPQLAVTNGRGDSITYKTPDGRHSVKVEGGVPSGVKLAKKRRGGRGGRGRRGGGGGKDKPKTSDELNNDLDSYMKTE